MAYREVGTYRGAAVLSGTTHKTVKRVITRREAGAVPARVPRDRNCDAVAELVTARSASGRGGPGITVAGWPAIWSPGEHLVIDWGAEGGLHVFCAVLAWSRVRFVRFAADERAETTLAMLAECFETLGGCRASCSRTGWAARRAESWPTSWCPPPITSGSPAITGSGTDFCEAADPNRKGLPRTWSAMPRPT
jgi:hypothetical protein